jgi:hypothetical protein
MADGNRPTYGGGIFGRAWQPSDDPGAEKTVLEIEAAKRGAWLAGIDMQMMALEEQQRQFDELLEQREEEFGETLGLQRERFDFETLRRRLGSRSLG